MDGGITDYFFFKREFIFILKNFWPHPEACGILVARPGIELVPPALEAQSLNHWTARDVPVIISYLYETGFSKLVS